MKQQIFLSINYFLAKISLACILFFAFVTIAGYNRNINSPQQFTPQVELICFTATRAGAKTGSFKKHIIVVNKTASYLPTSNLFVLLFQNRHVKLKFNALVKEIYTVPSNECLIIFKTISQNSGEDTFPAFTS